MRKLYLKIIMTVVLMLSVAINVWSGTGSGWNNVPQEINYQGRLLDGTNLVNGTKDIIIRVYDAATAGTLLYGETNSTVLINDGLYTLTIGDEAGFSSILTNSDLYLEIEIDTQILTPREQLTSVPYAMMAGGVTPSGITSDMIDDGAVTSNKLAVGAFTETDPVFANSDASDISDNDITNWDDATSDVQNGKDDWDEAYSWGDHGDEGYLTEDDFDDFSSVSGIDSSNISDWDDAASDIQNGKDDWDEAYSWGDHSAMGYLDGSYTENDPRSVLADGSRAMTGDLDMGGNSITNISTNTLVYSDGTSVASKYVDVAGDTMTGILLVSNDVMIASNLYVSGFITNAIYYGDGSGLTNITAHSYTETDPIYANDKAGIVFDGDAAGGDLTGTYPDPTIAQWAVTSNKIMPRAVTSEKVAQKAIMGFHIADGAVGTLDIFDSAVTSNKIATAAVNSAKILDETIESRDIKDGGIWGDDILAGEITSNHIKWVSMPTGLEDGDDVGILAEADTLQDVVNRGNTASNAVTFGTAGGTNVMLGSFQAGGDRLIDVSDNGFAVIDGTTTNTEFIVEQYAAGQWRIDAKGNPITNAIYYGDGSGLTNLTISYTETDPIYSAAAAASITSAGSGAVITGAERIKLGGIEDGADATDAANVDAAGAVMNGDIGTSVQAYDADLDDLADGILSKSKVEESANWDTAFGWGDHGTNGYLTAETDPIYTNDKSTIVFDGDAAGGALSGTYPNPTLAPLDLDNVVWVATNGTPAGTGSIDAPFNDPQQGYMAAVAKYPASPATVVICAGDYTNGIMMIAGNIHIQGIARPKITFISVQSTANPAILDGKMRVQGIVCKDDLRSTMVSQFGGGVKFVNCRFEQGIHISGNDVEFHHCQTRSPREPDGSTPSAAMAIGSLSGVVSNIMVVNTSIEWWRSDANGQAALLVLDMVRDLEVAGCEIVSKNSQIPAILDQQSASLTEPPLNAALHLYTHNYIKRPAVVGGTAAVVASAPLVMAFHQNTMIGDLGNAVLRQYFSNNMIYGAINWMLATGSWATDSANNTTFTGGEIAPSLPDPWND